MVEEDWFRRAIAPDDDGDAGSTAKLPQPINGPLTDQHLPKIPLETLNMHPALVR